MEIREWWRKFAVWSVVLLVVAGGLLWGLVYGARTLKESWMRSNEAAARQTLATLTRALKACSDRHQGYPDSLARLRGGEEGNAATAPPERARLLETALARDTFEQGGYRFRYEAGQRQQRWAATVPLYSSYRLTAEPLTPGGSGELFYYSDQTGELRMREGEPAGPDDPVAR